MVKSKLSTIKNNWNFFTQLSSYSLLFYQKNEKNSAPLSVHQIIKNRVLNSVFYYSSIVSEFVVSDSVSLKPVTSSWLLDEDVEALLVDELERPLVDAEELEEVV